MLGNPVSFIQSNHASLSGTPVTPQRPLVGGTALFWMAKRVFDVSFSLLLFIPFLICAAALLILNPFWNAGTLFYTQRRMGKDCKPFTAIKFRSMRAVAKVTRGAEDPIELDRITHLGRFIRQSRIDELPQILNVLKGDMSLIGPRPDYYTHAEAYLGQIPDYQARHVVRPGISGLAQVDVGYVEGTGGTRTKVRADLRYIKEAGVALEVEVFWKTLATVLGQKGC